MSGADHGSELAGRLLAAPDHEPHPAPLRGGPAYGTDTEEILDGYADALSLTDVRQLAYALDHGEPVTIEYMAASGSRTVRTVSDLEMDPPYLYGYCHLREDERVFSLSRVQSVLPG
ncbi:WYL domain-containing protein [Streptomyces fradiae]|uniref:WYL domain-containing protein n=1 Tax=Streptomyces fradiae TaxID=1906 RepID=UPI0029435145|nr:WYL domain-containing protein [Streptomyces fradiae]WOI62446.1 WYL domain-containing protein [Streptomyces fradiae]